MQLILVTGRAFYVALPLLAQHFRYGQQAGEGTSQLLDQLPLHI